MIKPQIGTALRLWMKEGLGILDKFEKEGWNLSIENVTRILNEAFWIYDIFFEFEENPINDNTRKYVECGLFKEDSTIFLYLRKEFLSFLHKLRIKKDCMVRWMDFSRNRFLVEYVQVLSHELLHRKQWQLGMIYDSRSSTHPDISMEEYLSFYTEIQALAQDTAFGLLYCKSLSDQVYYINEYKRYFGSSHPVFKKFMKTVHTFLEMMSKDRNGHLS